MLDDVTPAKLANAVCLRNASTLLSTAYRARFSIDRYQPDINYDPAKFWANGISAAISGEGEFSDMRDGDSAKDGERPSLFDVRRDDRLARLAQGVSRPAAEAADNSNSCDQEPLSAGSTKRFSHQLSLRDRLAALDWTPDLARNIGSLGWWRGSITLVGLSAVALAFWPDFSPATAAPAVKLDEQARDEFRSQMILPLALGADSGRRMSATEAVLPLKRAPERPRLELIATLSEGDSFSRMLQRAGVGAGEARSLASLISGEVDVDAIDSGTRFSIVLGRRPAVGEPRALESLNFRARFDLELGLERAREGFALNRRPIRVDTTPLRIRGTVGSSLYRAARAAGAPASAAQAYLRTLSSKVNVDTIASTDTFDFVVEYRRAETGEALPGKLLFAGLERDGKPRAQLLRWGKNGQFYEASGIGQQRGGMVSPVNGPISSRYGMRRHPILGYRRMHSGVDYRARRGTPIYSVTDGVVQYAGRKGGFGNFVKIGHGNGLASGYAHMSRIAVRNGARVRQGQVIGYVGSTGLSTGPHLHFEIYRNGRAVNPSSVQFVRRAQLEGGELQSFRARLASLKELEPGAALVSLAPRSSATTEPVREIDRVDQSSTSQTDET